MLKRLFDIGFSLFALTFSFPIIIVTALLIKIEDFTEHIFFLQTRVGKDRIPFKIIKFRTMSSRIVHEKEITVDGDPRITKVGKWVRKLKFDELPQFINVLKGDMSIVGPRPEVPKYVNLYNENQLEVLSVKPGITDHASIQFFNESEILAKSKSPEQTYINEILPEKLRLNLDYIKKQSLFTDLGIILKTISKILT